MRTLLVGSGPVRSVRAALGYLGPLPPADRPVLIVSESTRDALAEEVTPDRIWTIPPGHFLSPESLRGPLRGLAGERFDRVVFLVGPKGLLNYRNVYAFSRCLSLRRGVHALEAPDRCYQVSRWSILLRFVEETFLRCWCGYAPNWMIGRLWRTFLLDTPLPGWRSFAIQDALANRFRDLSEEEQSYITRVAWSGEGTSGYHARYETLDAENSAKQKGRGELLIQQVQRYLSAHPEVKTLCEIGTAYGQFLERLSKELPQIERWIGIDLATETITRNRKVYAGTRLEFPGTDFYTWGRAWRANENRPVCIISVGVLTYFTPSELDRWLRFIRDELGVAAVGIREPVQIDLSRETASSIRGPMAWNHNYPHLFEHYGYHIREVQIVPIRPEVPFYNTVCMVAETPGSRGAVSSPSSDRAT